ncbi:MAG: hypothetical protein R3284_12180 [Rubricoccaceae bacterium]|nr:hypothetical protein [Rubricoccaceae bacterium]
MRKAALGLRIVLVLAVITSTQGLLFVQGAFLLRQDYVASMLCVDRFKPESDCNGKCYLRRQMEQQTEMHHGSEGGHGDHGKAPALLELALSVHAILVARTDAGVDIPLDDATFTTRNERLPHEIEVPGVFHPPRIG